MLLKILHNDCTRERVQQEMFKWWNAHKEMIKKQYFNVFHIPLSPKLWGCTELHGCKDIQQESALHPFAASSFLMPALSSSQVYTVSFVLPDRQQGKSLRWQETKNLLTRQSKQRENQFKPVSEGKGLWVLMA